MTRNEFLNLKTASEMWKALMEFPELQTEELGAVFQQLREKEFEDSIIARGGSYDPDMHYDLNKKK